MQTITTATVDNMQILIPNSFESGKQYLPIGEQYNLNGKNIPAIPKFLSPPSGGGTFVLGSVGGQLTWLATESCD